MEQLIYIHIEFSRLVMSNKKADILAVDLLLNYLVVVTLMAIPFVSSKERVVVSSSS